MPQAPPVSGIVEADETWLSRSAKGQQKVRGSWEREPRQRASDQHVPGRSSEQVYVVVARDRSGRTCDAVLDKVTVRGLVELLHSQLAADAVLCSDGWQAYAGAARKLEVQHEVLSGVRNERVAETLSSSKLLDDLSQPGRLGAVRLGGIDLNRPAFEPLT